MKRRQFITSLGKLGVLSILPGIPKAFSFQSNKSPHFFILISVGGGMDCVAGLDPQLHSAEIDSGDVFTPYRPEDIIRVGNISLAPMAGSLKKFASEIAIVNGISMRRDAGHESLIDYMASGSGDGKAAYLPVEIAATFGSSGLGVVTTSSRKTTGPHSIGTFTPSSLANEGAGSAVTYFDIMKKLNSGDGSESQYSSSMRDLLLSSEDMVQFDNLRSESGIESGDLESMENLSQIIGMIFKSNLAHQGYIDLGFYDLDSHSNYEDSHLDNQSRVWADVATLFGTFKNIPFLEGSLFDFTTFMVTTEFSRTPFLNAANGKDHNPFTNSVLFAGKGINGGNTFGKSIVVPRSQTAIGQAIHTGLKMDMVTGQSPVDIFANGPNVERLYPENIARTVASIFNDPENFSSVSLQDIKAIPGLKKI